jgi:hypothetical protein
VAPPSLDGCLISGGATASGSDQFHATAALLFDFNNDGRFSLFCSGALVGPKSILTAEHCFQDMNDDDPIAESRYRVYLQREGLMEVELPRRRVDRADLAVLTLKRQVNAVAPTALVGAGTAISGNKKMFAGYGNGHGIKNHGELTAAVCNDDNRLICYAGEGVTPCNRDSGGPMYDSLAGDLVLIGIARSVTESCQRGEGTYVNLAYEDYHRWMTTEGALTGTSAILQNITAKAFHGNLPPDQSSAVTHAFDVPEGTASLRVTFNHSETASWHEPPNTQIEVTIFDPDGRAAEQCIRFPAALSQFSEWRCDAPQAGGWTFEVERRCGEGNYQLTVLALPVGSEE